MFREGGGGIPMHI